MKNMGHKLVSVLTSCSQYPHSGPSKYDVENAWQVRIAPRLGYKRLPANDEFLRTFETFGFLWVLFHSHHLLRDTHWHTHCSAHRNTFTMKYSSIFGFLAIMTMSAAAMPGAMPDSLVGR